MGGLSRAAGRGAARLIPAERREWPEAVCAEVARESVMVQGDGPGGSVTTGLHLSRSARLQAHAPVSLRERGGLHWAAAAPFPLWVRSGALRSLFACISIGA